MCGVFALTQAQDAARLTFLGLFALQHRGQESAGISTVSPEGTLLTHKGNGLVSDVFTPETLAKLGGTAAIGHVRYSTAGGSLNANIQPLTARIARESIAIAHNGNIANAEILREQLETAGSILQGTADTEIILHLIARSSRQSFTERFLDAARLMQGAVTCVIASREAIYGYVDPLGYRPLALGKLGTGWVLASETCALDLVGANYVRDILPGELVAIRLDTQELTSSLTEPKETPSTEKRVGAVADFGAGLDQSRARCVFEHIYFGRPDSYLWGQSSTVKRTELGAALAREAPADADLVMAIPDSGIPIAMGYAQESGLPYQLGLIRNHYVGRTFIEPTQNVRNFRVRLKLNPVRQIVKGKRLVVVDDSIVRGTTSRRIIELLREAGAREVHMRIGSPQVRFPCFYGIDTPKRRELLAQTFTDDEMRAFLGADSLVFLREETLVHVMDHGLEAATAAIACAPKCKNWCTSCFSGNYQDEFAQQASRLEGLATEL
jgi:amidophosphoribosyltransferase